MNVVIFNGLNTEKQETNRFTYYFNEIGFHDILTNFDSVLHLKITNECKAILYFDFDKKTFQKLNLKDVNINDLLTIATNTDYAWLLNREGKLFQLKKPFDKINKSIQLNLNNYDKTVDGDIFICSTDVNCYLLSSKSSKCVFQSENGTEKTTRINESPVLAIPINKTFFDEEIKEVSCGKEHVLILTAPSGLVYSFGIGTHGQLGHGTIDNCYEPKLIENFKNVKHISCGGWHSALIDQDGNLYMWGWNLNGQLGVYDDLDEDEDENETIISVPTLVNMTNDFGAIIKFKKVSLGSRHSLFLTNDNKNSVYGVGWNKYRQVTVDMNDEDVKTPILIENSVKDIKAGPWYSLILT